MPCSGLLFFFFFFNDVFFCVFFLSVFLDHKSI